MKKAYLVDKHFIYCDDCVEYDQSRQPPLESWPDPAFCSACGVFMENELSNERKSLLEQNIQLYSAKKILQLTTFYKLNVKYCQSCRKFVKEMSISVCASARCVYKIPLCLQCTNNCVLCETSYCPDHINSSCAGCNKLACTNCIREHRNSCKPFIRYSNRQRPPKTNPLPEYIFVSDTEE